MTAGAAELNPASNVVGAGELVVHVIDRCNLTILEEPGACMISRSSSPAMAWKWHKAYAADAGRMDIQAERAKWNDA